jgi:hypothetical protein
LTHKIFQSIIDPTYYQIIFGNVLLLMGFLLEQQITPLAGAFPIPVTVVRDFMSSFSLKGSGLV